MAFEFMTAGRIVVGPGCASNLVEIARSLGRGALVAHGRTARSRGAVAEVLQSLDSAGLTVVSIAVDGEPTLESIDGFSQQARGCDLVIGIGGGSVIDTAKAVATLGANEGPLLRYLEIIGEGRPLESPALPLIAVPTTAGTGSEVTRNAVIGVPHRKVKVSLRDASLIPRVAVVDSALTHALPPEVTASSGLDALTQLLEACVSRRASPITDGLCAQGLDRISWALRRTYHRPSDGDAREAMCVASLLSGMALANAGLGAVHGIAGAIGGAFPAPHGAVCAALLPAVTGANIRRCSSDGSESLTRYRKAATWLMRSPATAHDLASWLKDLVAELQIPRLSTYGVVEQSIPGLAAAAAHANSTRTNPVQLSENELADCIRAAL